MLPFNQVSDPHPQKSLDPDPHEMYMDPKHCLLIKTLLGPWNVGILVLAKFSGENLLVSKEKNDHFTPVLKWKIEENMECFNLLFKGLSCEN